MHDYVCYNKLYVLVRFAARGELRRLMSVKNKGISEMVSYLPISSPFITFAGRYVDDAFEAAVGLNFFIFQAFLVPFEIVACNIVIQFWTDSIPIAAVISILLVVLG